MSPPAAPLTPEDRAALSRRAVAAAVQVAVAHGVAVSEPSVLAERYALRVHLRPAPLVARVSTFTALLREPIAAWLGRELSVTRFLHGHGAPVVPPSELLPAGPHVHDGFAISFWAYEPPVSDELPSPEVAGRMLAELHRALRGYSGELPHLAPPLNDIPRSLERLERMPRVLAEPDRSLLCRLAERLLPALERLEAPVQPLHGDAHVYNVIRSARGLVWNDFEDTCLGPVAWDLASLGDPEGQALAAYAAASHEDAPSPETLATIRDARTLHGVLWVLALQPEVDEFAHHARGMLDALRTLG